MVSIVDVIVIVPLPAFPLFEINTVFAPVLVSFVWKFATPASNDAYPTLAGLIDPPPSTV
ncbi:MAG: hypothetical protein NT099_01660 [Candidatus Saganbacteria bacterium]|nr:hypothetical protein [Candidatus Saganbacteria bacterium]